ncbi:putative transcriptional regulator YdeE [Pedobacter sp. UYEF25]
MHRTERIRRKACKLIGIKLDQKTMNKDGRSSIDCGKLWQKFEIEKFETIISNKLSGDIYAVYYEYEGDYTKPVNYFIGYEVELNAVIPDGMVQLFVPQGTYTKIFSKGKMPDCVANSWKAIWQSQINRNYTFDFEVYTERSKDWNNAELEIFVSTH